MQVGEHDLSVENLAQPFRPFIVENAFFIVEVALQPRDRGGLDRLGPLVLLLALAGEDLRVDDRARNPGRRVERRVLDVAGFLAEDRPQEFFLRR